jgi:hypothetical protein
MPLEGVSIRAKNHDLYIVAKYYTTNNCFPRRSTFTQPRKLQDHVNETNAELTSASDCSPKKQAMKEVVSIILGRRKS